MKRQIIILLLIINVFTSYSQKANLDYVYLNTQIKLQANKMGNAFISNEFQTFVKYSNPKLIKMIGGAKKMSEVVNKSIVDMKAKGMIFESITFSEPTKIVISGNELQSTIQQFTKVKTPNGGAMSTSTLIAISADKGVNWTFVDTSNKDMATIKQLLPNLSTSIIIPKQVPVKYY